MTRQGPDTAVGIVYAAVGERHLRRLKTSLASLTKVMPEIPITLFTDVPVVDLRWENIIVEPSEIQFMDKILAMQRSPYDRTVFLDADTYVCYDFSDVFSILDRFDMAVAHDTYRMYVCDFERVREIAYQIPESFPFLNSGVIAFRRSKIVVEFFQNWKTIHERNTNVVPSGGGDQLAFREALYFSDLRFSALAHEYNCRFVTPVFVNERVKILHGPYRDFDALEDEVNRRIENRAFFPRLGTVFDDDSPLEIRRWRLREWTFRIMKRVKRVAKRWMRAN